MAVKLTQQQRDAVRAEYAAGGISQAALARKWGVSPKQISHIVNPAQLAKDSACSARRWDDPTYRAAQYDKMRLRREQRAENDPAFVEAENTRLREYKQTRRADASLNEQDLAYNRQRYANNLDSARAVGRHHRSLRRARVHGAGGDGGYSVAQLGEIRAVLYTDSCCPICTAACEDWHLDHVVPLTRGGSHDRTNLLLVCSTCNQRKGNKLLEEWLPSRAAEIKQLAANIAGLFV